ncbi:[protein-PII] uridylyltransferase [Comamonadaceae bacterium OH2545_COT-014]|nr:[protein-PII] uridylyltransferase [Comamonadaceae bacterium OH2545_COT-014]
MTTPTPRTDSTTLPALRARYAQGKQALLDELLADGTQARGLNRIHKTLARLARLADELLRALWRRAALDATPCALLAVGGFGRGELFPHSDVDVLVLLPDGDAPPREALEAFIAACWDAGLEIGSSVRTVADCLRAAQADVTVCTTLVEARLVTGNAALHADFQARFAAQLDPLAFLVAKKLEQRQRHVKHEDTPYALEPNCKESPGGLRDLHTIRWVARAAGLGQSWKELGANGLATTREARQLARNESLLSLIRAHLHLLARRREDRLVFDLQTAVAESFGYQNRFSPSGRLAERASEQLMRRYYWCAKAVTQLSQILMQVIEERLRAARAPLRPARRINAHFLDKGSALEVASDDLYQRHPHAILQTFLLYQTEVGIRHLSARTLRALYNARALMDSRFRADPVNRATFMRILQQGSGITHAFRLMNQTSVLGRYLWVFRRIVGQMQHDLFHVYTVDQHTLMVLRNMRRFFIPEHAHEYPFCSQLAAGWDKPWLLYVAALFHDIAKGRGGDHSVLGAQEARRFCRQHGIEGADADLIEFLVREHLSMSRVAQKEDLSDPAVITRFAAQTGSERRLTALYLLTVADIRGTSPKVWNAWKGKLLQDLYRAAVHALGGRAPDPGALVESRKREALALLHQSAPPTPEADAARQALWQTFDMGYFMRHDAGEIAWHARTLVQAAAPIATKKIAQSLTTTCLEAQKEQETAPSASLPALVRARRSPAGEGLQVLVYAADRPDLFSRLCGWFDRAGFSILDARIHTTLNGWALDTFQIVRATACGEAHEWIAQVEAELPAAIGSTAALPPPRLGRQSRRVRSFPITPRIELQPDDKAQRWLLSISASDRTGLLYGISRVLARHGISLELAKISTLGERVEDTFLLHGPGLQHAKAQLAFEQELLAVLASARSA